MQDVIVRYEVCTDTGAMWHLCGDLESAEIWRKRFGKMRPDDGPFHVYRVEYVRVRMHDGMQDDEPRNFKRKGA